MKKILFLLALCASFTFSACNDDDALEEFMTANIDGNAFEASRIIAIGDNSLGGELVFVTGANADATFTIGLNIPTDIAENTPLIIGANDLGITFTDDANNAFFTVGMIELSNIDTGDKVLEGTFDFVATDDDDPTSEYSITDGAFRIEY